MKDHNNNDSRTENENEELTVKSEKFSSKTETINGNIYTLSNNLSDADNVASVLDLDKENNSNNNIDETNVGIGNGACLHREIYLK